MKKILASLSLCFLVGITSFAVEGHASNEIMQRMYNPNSGEHFYTASLSERNALLNAGWQHEGIG
nr:hypothetical protein [Enterococcus sp. CSURQ0835]